MAKYKVWISFSGWSVYDITANSEDEARDIAMQRADTIDCDSWNIDAVEVEENN